MDRAFRFSKSGRSQFKIKITHTKEKSEMVSIFCFISVLFSIFLNHEKFDNHWQGFSRT